MALKLETKTAGLAAVSVHLLVASVGVPPPPPMDQSTSETSTGAEGSSTTVDSTTSSGTHGRGGPHL